MKIQLTNMWGFVAFFLLLTTDPVFSQTAVDTASVIKHNIGTKKDAIPHVADPMQPLPIVNSDPQALAPLNKIVGKKIANGSNRGKIMKLAETTDTVLFNAYRNSMVAYYHAIERKNIDNTATLDSVTSYYVWALQNRQKTISRQQATGTAIFALVVLLVLSGLIFAAIQFYIALKGGKNQIPGTNFDGFGIKVSSSVLGIIILAISIVFFYLYLINVYPIAVLDQATVQTAQ